MTNNSFLTQLDPIFPDLLFFCGHVSLAWRPRTLQATKYSTICRKMILTIACTSAIYRIGRIEQNELNLSFHLRVQGVFMKQLNVCHAGLTEVTRRSGKNRKLSTSAGSSSITLLLFSSIFQPRKCTNFRTTGFSVCTLIIGVCGDHNVANKFYLFG